MPEIFRSFMQGYGLGEEQARARELRNALGMPKAEQTRAALLRSGNFEALERFDANEQRADDRSWRTTLTTALRQPQTPQTPTLPSAQQPAPAVQAKTPGPSTGELGAPPAPQQPAPQPAQGQQIDPRAMVQQSINATAQAAGPNYVAALEAALAAGRFEEYFQLMEMSRANTQQGIAQFAQAAESLLGSSSDETRLNDALNIIRTQFPQARAELEPRILAAAGSDGVLRADEVETFRRSLLELGDQFNMAWQEHRAEVEDRQWQANHELQRRQVGIAEREAGVGHRSPNYVAPTGRDNMRLTEYEQAFTNGQEAILGLERLEAIINELVVAGDFGQPLDAAARHRIERIAGRNERTRALYAMMQTEVWPQVLRNLEGLAPVTEVELGQALARTVNADMPAAAALSDVQRMIAQARRGIALSGAALDFANSNGSLTYGRDEQGRSWSETVRDIYQEPERAPTPGGRTGAGADNTWATLSATQRAEAVRRVRSNPTLFEEFRTTFGLSEAQAQRLIWGDARSPQRRVNNGVQR